MVRGFSSEDFAPVSRGCAVRSDVPGGVKSGALLARRPKGSGDGLRAAGGARSVVLTAC